MSKIGYHVNVWTPAARGTVRTQRDGRILKVLNTSVDPNEISRWRQSNPNGIVVYRHVFGDEDLRFPRARCQELIQSMTPIAGLVDVVETPWNETAQTLPAIRELAAAELQAIKTLRDMLPDHRIAVGNCSVGNPPSLFADWLPYLPVVAAADYLSLHEYGSPYMHSEPGDLHGENRPRSGGLRAGYWMLRYRLVYPWLARQLDVFPPPLLLTEIGRDHGLLEGKPGGWRKKGVAGTAGHDEEVYAEELRSFNREISRDERVHGATIFACGTYNDFATFDVAGCGHIEAAVNQIQPMIIPVTPEPKSTPSVNGKIVTAPASEGKTLFDEWRDTPGNDNPMDGGVVALAAFLRHLKNLGIRPLTKKRAIELGFPRQSALASGADWRPPIPAPPDGQNVFAIAADRYQIDPATLRAVLAVESGGQPFGHDGRLLIRFELHVFQRQISLFGSDEQRLAFGDFFHFAELTPAELKRGSSWRGVTHTMWQYAGGKSSVWTRIHTGQQATEYQALDLARKISVERANESCSLGAPQIMGFHFARLGHASATDMWSEMEESQAAQLEIFLRFLGSDVNLLNALRRDDIETFARLYNGPAQAQTYASLIREQREVERDLS